MAPNRSHPRRSSLEGTPHALRDGLPHVPAIRTLPELHCELRSAQPDYALAALNAFVAPKIRFPANLGFVERSLDQAQRAFPEHNEAFSRLRSAYNIRSHLPPLVTAASGGSLPTTATGSGSSSQRRRAQHRAQQRLREFAEQRAVTEELHFRLRGSTHEEAVTALDNFLIDAISDWDAQFAINSVDDAERVFGEHSEAFAYIRSEWHLPPMASGGGSMPVTPTSSAMPRSPILSPTALSPASPRLNSCRKLPPASGSGLDYGLSSPERPPDYTKDDPDPSSTRLLEQRLAAEADTIPPYGLGMSFLTPAPMYGCTLGMSGAAGPIPSYLAHDPRYDASSPPLSDGAHGINMSETLEMEVSPLSDDDMDNDNDTDNNNDDVNDIRTEMAGISVGGGRRASAAAGVGGLPLMREGSGSTGPTYTFTAEQLAGAGRDRGRAWGSGPRRPAPRTGRHSDFGPVSAISNGGSGTGSRTGSTAVAPYSRQSMIEYRPTYIFTADDLARVGQIQLRRQSQIGLGLGWKSLLPRRSSAPLSSESPPRLFRSLSRGER